MYEFGIWGSQGLKIFEVCGFRDLSFPGLSGLLVFGFKALGFNVLGMEFGFRGLGASVVMWFRGLGS